MGTRPADDQAELAKYVYRLEVLVLYLAGPVDDITAWARLCTPEQRALIEQLRARHQSEGPARNPAGHRRPSTSPNSSAAAPQALGAQP